MSARNIDTGRYIAKSADEVGEDIDLNAEHFTDAEGNSISEATTDEFTTHRAEEARQAGRPSLGAGGTSPQTAFRIPAELRDQAAAIASREGRTVSAIAREQLERYISDHAA